MNLHTDKQCKEKLEGIKILLESTQNMVEELIYEFTEEPTIEIDDNNHYEKLKEYTENLYDGIPPE